MHLCPTGLEKACRLVETHWDWETEITDCMLARAIQLLCVEFEQPAHRNINFVGKRVLELVTAGHRLADIETALRSCDAPIFLIGLPWVAEKQVGYELFHPDKGLAGAALRYSLWIGINGQDEVDSMLAQASQTPTTNLVNLNATGFIAVNDEGTKRRPAPTVGELLRWLLLDAPTWTARRDALLQHQQLLSTDEALSTLTRVAKHVGRDSSALNVTDALRDLLVRMSQDGRRLAFQNCRFLVLEALHAFLDAPSWPDAARVYAYYDDELSGDLAAEILTELKRNFGYTATQRTIIEVHLQVLESAWEHGIETAIADAESRFPTKSGTPGPEDYLRVYLRAPDLEAACEALRTASADLLQLDDDSVIAGMRRANTDELWRLGLFQDARDRGVEDSYGDWAELLSIAALTDSEEAVRRLHACLDRNSGCWRDQCLELLLQFHSRLGNLEAQQAIAQELVDRRSGASLPGRRPVDLVNLGVISSKRGDLTTARAAFQEARNIIDQLVGRPSRAECWLKVGVFSRDYDRDVAMALHSFRVAAEECAAANDGVSKSYAFEQLSSLYRSLGRADLAYVYAVLAEQSIADLGDDVHGIAGSSVEVRHLVEKGVAVTAFLVADYELSAQRVQWLINESPFRIDDDERAALERVALACAIESGDWTIAHEIVTSWSAGGRHDWALIGRATIRLRKLAQNNPDAPIDPERSVDFVGVAEALSGAGASDVEDLLRPSTYSALSRALVDTVAGVIRADPLTPTRLLGDHEAAIWVSRSERARPVARTITQDADRPSALPSAASWLQIIAHYDRLGVWEVPDLTVIGAILDQWSLLSRFEDAVRINPVPPCNGCLNVYFYRSDPAGHLDSSVSGCVFVPDGDLIICKLDYIDDLFRVGRVSWDAEVAKIKKGLVDSNWADADNLAVLAGNKIRARERILVEWLIAHEIGHAHFGHSRASPGKTALEFEDQADSFFIEGAVHTGGLGEIVHSIYGQLGLLYAYDCENRLNRALTPEELSERSLRLDPSPDASGHRPLVFRAISLLRSIQRMHPGLGEDSYLEQFAASIEGR
jgi:tetratricopeptide (TPR) repeat protein